MSNDGQTTHIWNTTDIIMASHQNKEVAEEKTWWMGDDFEIPEEEAEKTKEKEAEEEGILLLALEKAEATYSGNYETVFLEENVEINDYFGYIFVFFSLTASARKLTTIDLKPINKNQFTQNIGRDIVVNKRNDWATCEIAPLRCCLNPKSWAKRSGFHMRHYLRNTPLI